MFRSYVGRNRACAEVHQLFKRFDGADVPGPELMVNHLLRLVEGTLA